MSGSATLNAAPSSLAPALTQSRTLAISSLPGRSLAELGGMIERPLPSIDSTRMLSSGTSGTSTGPLSEPMSMALYEVRSSPPLADLGLWHVEQYFAKNG